MHIDLFLRSSSFGLDFAICDKATALLLCVGDTEWGGETDRFARTRSLSLKTWFEGVQRQNEGFITTACRSHFRSLWSRKEKRGGFETDLDIFITLIRIVATLPSHQAVMRDLSSPNLTYLPTSISGPSCLSHPSRLGLGLEPCSTGCLRHARSLSRTSSSPDEPNRLETFPTLLLPPFNTSRVDLVYYVPKTLSQTLTPFNDLVETPRPDLRSLSPE